MIPGPAGLLEVLVSPGERDAWAIFCHPHPLYGGSMDDAVLEVARSRFAATGGGTVLFNFRGVGSSEGRHDGGDGEVDDVVAVAQWLDQTHSVGTLTLVGYSFGSSVAWRALATLEAADSALLIAPPIGSMAYPAIAKANAAVIAGSNDPFVDADALKRWLATQPGATHIAIAGADHFFRTSRNELAQAVDEAFSAR